MSPHWCCLWHHWTSYDRFWCAWAQRGMPEWRPMHVKPQQFEPGLESAATGFAAAPPKEGKKSHSASREFTADALSNLARTRDCRKGCNTFLHFCSYRCVCCMVLHPRICSPWRRAVTRGSDKDSRYFLQRAFATSPKSWIACFWRSIWPELARSDLAKRSSKLDIWPEFQPKPGRIFLAKQSSKPDIWREV